MIPRLAVHKLKKALARQSAVALLGPRQVGKTTLALALVEDKPALYLDLETKSDRDKLSYPQLFLSEHSDKLVILDEIHCAPELFQTLRGIIDERRRAGQRTGQFLVLGSAAIDLLRQSGESLAGRIEYVDLGSLSILEVGDNLQSMNQLWLRGGFPDSYLAADDEDSFHMRLSFIRTYLERDVPQFGPRIPAELLERLWTMLAHNQGSLLNVSRLAAGLMVSTTTISTYIGLLVDLLLVRRLYPYHANVGKRLVKSPKTYVRDSGLVHALLGIRNSQELAGHPIVGASWEGFAIENILAAAPEHAKASFYRTAAGAEIDLILELGGQCGTWAIEIKRGLTAKPTRGFYQGLTDVKPNKVFVVHSGRDRYPLEVGVEAIGLHELAEELQAIS